MKIKILKGGLKMEQKYISGIIALTIVVVLGVSMISAMGFGKGLGFASSELTDEEKTQMQEQRQAMETAIENKDYTTWKSLMEQEIAKMQSQITEENFNKVVENHARMSELRIAMKEARESGDFSKIQELKEELGMDEKDGKFGRGMKKGLGLCPKLDNTPTDSE